MLASVFTKIAIKKVISELVKNNPKQLTIREYSAIANTLLEKKESNMLVFGVGQDSKLWMQANKKGKTFFLENSISWFAQIRTENPKINGFIIRYNTLRKDWKLLLENPSLDLMLALPDEISTKNWDVIFIDGPKGSNDSAPGRMQSIYTTSVLSAKSKNIDVFVHDCDRQVEKAYCDRFFGNMRLVAEFDRLRHYKNVFF